MIRYIVEFLGTFVFLSVILSNSSNPVAIAVALLAAIYFGGRVSGGHFNPAVSVMMALQKSLALKELPLYVIAQLLGGVAALQFSKLTVKK